ncbi:B12-binding domain-containing radical SAM protein [Fontivita pretiosa]|uniref:B12-binding domain-containing radical SAM protein n=1 Tax=Fontivita pretiosa TaxID=2989684 RepID=UPI003D17B917
MRVLLLYPEFPTSFWSFEKTIKLLGRKAMLPPLGLITVAALLPQDWQFKLVDRNIRQVTEQEWAWAEIVMLSAMIVQRRDFAAQVHEAKRRGKRVVVGGPYPTALPQECVDADYLVLDEAEITLPLFLEALARGEKRGVFRSNGEKPDVTQTPIPRFDLLELDAYTEMSVQFSRGCPFMCEFCDIIVLYGRRPRTKTPDQMLAELQRLYDLGWRRSVFVVDDNFIGNKKNVKALLRQLKPWMFGRGYPFSFATESSVDLAQDQELMDLMRQCNFGAVFLGIETPDTQSLVLTKKTQNNRDPLADSVRKIARSGIRIMAGFIIGFDNEKRGAGERIVRFVEQTSIPTATFSMLQALPDTALSHRLAREGRLLDNALAGADINQTTLMNFVPTRPIEQIAEEYVEGFWRLYDPIAFLDRTFRHFMLLKEADYPRKPRPLRRKLNLQNIRALATIMWRQGVLRKTRWRFWKNLYRMCRLNRGGIGSYLSTCAQIEHLLYYRQLVRDQIHQQLARQRDSSKTSPHQPTPSHGSPDPWRAAATHPSSPQRGARLPLPVLANGGQS